MRKSDATVERFRIEGDGMNGAFLIPYSRETYNPGKTSSPECHLAVIASNEGDWDHVSVHVRDAEAKEELERCPTWDEMKFVKELFFLRTETVVQYHPAESDYVNIHEFVLHLWRPQRVELPMPPQGFV